MSAPGSGSSGSSAASPVPGYYPDPSIPHYIRYWNGAAWVPGTSRPAQAAPEPVAAEPVAAPVPAPAQALDESGPMFFDEDPGAPLADLGAVAAPAAASAPAKAPAPAPAPAKAPTSAPAPAPAPVWPKATNPGPAPGAEPQRISWGADPLPAQQTAPPAEPAPRLRPEPEPEKKAPAPWAQQVHHLARGSEGAHAERAPQVRPRRPPVAEPFLRAAAVQRRPGSLVRRFAARVLDTLLFCAVTGVAAVPLGADAYRHVQDKVDEARQSGGTVQVWLLDSTTGAELGAVLLVALCAGLLLEVLPTARWGRTVGKKLVGLRVLDVASQAPPRFGASLRRWLTHTVLDVLVLGLLGLAWCLFDRPWRQCWHDKAARTFVAAV